jgi:hypothetical protein
MRKKAMLIAEGWNEYRERVIPSDAHESQVIGSKRAFYAGAQSLLSNILTMLDPGEEPSENDLAMMDDLESEIVQYCLDVLEGKE